MYRIIYQKEAEKILRKLPVNQLQRIKFKMELVAGSPFADHQNLMSLKGMVGGYRLRVGNLRVVYEVDTKKNLIIVWRVGFRGSVYR